MAREELREELRDGVRGELREKPRGGGAQEEQVALGSLLSQPRLRDYDVGAAMGKGKFSVVFKAVHRASGDECALKKIAVFSSMSAAAQDKCLKEVGLIRSLRHENIIQYRDAFVEEDDLNIVFEWASAGDLKRQIRKARERGRRFPERLVWKYFGEICAAIQHMHARRIMHRDLKPANVFLMTDGTVKVGDLGLSRLLSDDTLHAHTKVGTPLYMAPELLHNDGYDWKSDIWSLGCILYELGMLRSPFKEEGLSLVDLFKKIEAGKFTPLESCYSPEMRALTEAMVTLDPAARPEITVVVDFATAMNDRLALPAEESASAAASGYPLSLLGLPPPPATTPVPVGIGMSTQDCRLEGPRVAEGPTAKRKTPRAEAIDRKTPRAETIERKTPRAAATERKTPRAEATERKTPRAEASPKRSNQHGEKSARQKSRHSSQSRGGGSGGSGGGGGGSAAGADGGGFESGPVTIILDELRDLLALLGSRPLERGATFDALYFLNPPHAGGGPSGYERFRQFEHLASQLLAENGVRWRADDMYSPLQNVSALLDAAGVISRELVGTKWESTLSEAMLATIHPAQLLSGSGLATVRLLRGLARLALFKQRGFRFGTPDYPDDAVPQDEAAAVANQTGGRELDDGTASDSDSDVQSELDPHDDRDDDSREELIHPPDRHGSSRGSRAPRKPVPNSSEEESHAWRASCERVNERLSRAHRRNILARSGNDGSWRDRLGQLRRCAHALAGPERGATAVAARLEALSVQLGESLELIRRREERLTCEHRELGESYAAQARAAREARDCAAALAGAKEKQLKRYEEVQEQLEAARQLLEEQNHRVSDQSRLRELRAALKRLRRETVSMNRNVGVLLAQDHKLIHTWHMA